jgi:protoporphyrinogen/coproporphyrinogen III oxidase
MPPHPKPEIAVIGGGIAGLTAAWDLSEAGDVAVTVFEASEALGGKLSSTAIADVTIDAGAESLIAARPEGISLAAQVGLRPSVVHPAVREAAVLSRGALRTLPPGLVSGVPTDLRALAASRIMSLHGLLRIPMDEVRGGIELQGDVSVGDLLSERLGPEVVDRLAEPLLAGVYAGDPYQLSLQMANPSLFRQLQRDKSLLKAARAVRAGSASSAGARRGPVFAGIRGGVFRLAAKTADAIVAHGGHIRTSTPVTMLRRTPEAWQVITDDRTYAFDGVIIAVPAYTAAPLLRTIAPFTAVQLMSIEYASVALVVLAYHSADTRDLKGTGFLVPPVEGYAVKGVTYTTQKWEWAARAAKTTTRRGLSILRASVGRYGDEQVLDLDDTELIAQVQSELADIIGTPAKSLHAEVIRWPAALPQYRVGHAEVVEKARAALQGAPGLALAGAAYDGVGVASCIASGHTAARQVFQYALEHRTEAHG